ncbi:hypothetical protein [Jiella sp. R10]|uniref:Uncharacterized protein n=2 Tax=Antarcticirhabdus aurantiaca TaxID=2606717 RepID=A0ACD4NKE4_9HYPH|nr:hypothetical protein OXU80_21450 [Jeongeuplla avenae]
MVASLMETGKSPVEYLVDLYRDENADAKDRAWAANAAAPYMHPRIAPAASKVVLDLPDTSTPAGVKEAIGAVIKAVAAGEIAPAEGQHLVSIIEAQRKAIETTDLASRMEALVEALEAKEASSGRR